MTPAGVRELTGHAIDTPAEDLARPRVATQLLSARAEETPGDVATFHRVSTGAWVGTTWSTLWEEVQRAAAVFRALGLTKGDRLAVLARTCREWQVAELAALLAGATVVGIDAHAAGEQVAWLLEDSKATGLVVDGPWNLARVPDAPLQRLKFTLMLDRDAETGALAGVRQWGQAMSAQAFRPLEPVTQPSPSDPAMLIYTSGTTGVAKGVEYSHEAIMTACWAMLDEFPDFRQGRLVCWLPMASLFQRMMNLVAFASRSVTYFVEDPREIVPRLAEIRPTVFTSVPRFYEKVYEGIQERLATRSRAQQRLVRAALAVGVEWSHAERNGVRPGWALRVRHAVMDRLVLRKIRAVMGGDIQLLISGSAAAPAWLLEFFHSIGLLVLEAYGITENPVPIAANRCNAYRFGSVGKPFLLNQVRLGDDGEVMVKGPALFRSYQREGEPAGRFTVDGYYRTGDYGRFDRDGFLYLTGRIAEMIKTSAGRRISPAAVEGVYRQSRYVEQVLVVGNNRPHLVALVVPNGPAVEAGRAGGSSVELVKNDLEQMGRRLAAYEQIRAFVILSEPFGIENGELTSTLKLRRDGIAARYSALVEAMYHNGGERMTSAAGPHPGRGQGAKDERA